MITTQIPQDCEEFACPWCGLQCGSTHSLMRHITKCPHNENLEPEKGPEDV